MANNINCDGPPHSAYTHDFVQSNVYCWLPSYRPDQTFNILNHPRGCLNCQIVWCNLSYFSDLKRKIVCHQHGPWMKNEFCKKKQVNANICVTTVIANTDMQSEIDYNDMYQ